jgi:protein phosphatase
MDRMIEVEAAGLSDPGPNRSNNEDTIGAHAPADTLLRERKGFLYALADGLGGHLAGEVASTTAVSTIIDEYYSPSSHSRVEPALRRAVERANLKVFDLAQKDPAYRSMATTLSALALAGAHAYIAHIGDSRVYHWRDGRLAQLTVDHSEVAELVRMRIVKPEDAATHPRRNVLTRSLGDRLIVRPDFLRQPLKEGDQFLQCSDGLWAEVSDEEMAAIVGAHAPGDACRVLLDTALGRACLDNVSVQVVKVVAVTPDGDTGSRREGWMAGILQRIGRG